MVVQREVCRSHAGSFQIGSRTATKNFRASRWICERAGGTREAHHMPFGIAPNSVPEARKKLAGGETTGSARPTIPNLPRALEGREKGTRGLAGDIAGEHSNVSRAPAGAHPVSGVEGRLGSGGSRSLRDLHHRLISFEPPARQYPPKQKLIPQIVHKDEEACSGLFDGSDALLAVSIDQRAGYQEADTHSTNPFQPLHLFADRGL